MKFYLYIPFMVGCERLVLNWHCGKYLYDTSEGGEDFDDYVYILILIF